MSMSTNLTMSSISNNNNQNYSNNNDYENNYDYENIYNNMYDTISSKFYNNNNLSTDSYNINQEYLEQEYINQCNIEQNAINSSENNNMNQMQNEELSNTTLKTDSNSTTETKNNNQRRYTGVGVLIITNYLDKPYIVLGMEKKKSKKYQNKILQKLNTMKSNMKSSTKPNNQDKDNTKPNNLDKDNKNVFTNESDNSNIYLYEEFGGGIQNNHLTLEENACFELNEETCNLINFTNPFILNKGVNTFFDIPYLKDRMYRLHVIFIPEFTNLVHLFYKNKQLLKSAPSNYFKYRNFCEMSDMNIIELDHIYKYKDNINNYFCFNAEENLYNQIIHDKGNTNFRGILKCPDNIYLSMRIVDFLNMNFIYNKSIKGYKYYNGDIDHNINKEMFIKFSSTVKNYKPYMITGIDFCKYIYKQGMYSKKNNIKTNFINITKPRKNNKHNSKYNFLMRTWSVDGY